MRKIAAILLVLTSFLTASAAHADYKLNPHTNKKDYYEPKATASAPQSLATGGTGASLSDPAANKLLGWDDTDNAVKFLTIGSGLSYDAGTDTLSASAGSGDVTGVGDCADGACYDGSSDGGTYIRLYDGDSHYTQIASANVAGNVTITLPAVTSTVATLAGTETLTNKTLAAADNVVEADTGDSATSFFSTGTIEDARLPASMADKTITGYLNIPNGTDPTTDAAGELAFDTDAQGAGRGSLQIFDGTANTNAVAVLASDTCTNGQIPTWNTGGTWTCETAGGGLTIGTTAIASGGANRILFENGSTTLQSSSEFTFDTTNGLIINEAGGTAIDVRAEGDTTTHLLFVDASADKVGIGTSSPTQARLVVQTAVSGGVAGYFQNTGNQVGDSAIQAWTGNGGSSANTYMRGGFNYSPGIYVGGSQWYGVGGFSGDNGGAVALLAVSAAPEGDANDYAAFIQGGSSVFVDTDMVLYDGTNGEVMRLNPGAGGTSFTFGSSTDLTGLFNIDGRADEVQLWIQAYSTQTSNVVLVEKSDGTDILTVANTGSMRLVPVSAPPGTPASGDIYVDSDSTPDELCFYDGAAWQGISSGTDANCA